MYRLGESMKLEYLKNKLGFNPETILDIGAHTGQFYGWVKNVWPDSFVWMLEANDCHTEGASYYKESAYWDIPQLVLEIPKKLQTLDVLFDDNSKFDLIKMDTQGSELDIIKGGLGICKKSSYIILEVAVTEYNLGAPLELDVINFMENIGFENIATIGEHVDDDVILQKDILFKNKEIK